MSCEDTQAEASSVGRTEANIEELVGVLVHAADLAERFGERSVFMAIMLTLEIINTAIAAELRQRRVAH